MLEALAYGLHCILLRWDWPGSAFVPWVGILTCGAVAICSVRRGMATVRVGYVSFAFFALLVADFQIGLHLNGGDIFMLFAVYLAQFVILGSIGSLMASLSSSSGGGLRLLRRATVVLAACQVISFMGIISSLMNWIARAYVVLVFTVIAVRRREWMRPTSVGYMSASRSPPPPPAAGDTTGS